MKAAEKILAFSLRIPYNEINKTWCADTTKIPQKCWTSGPDSRGATINLHKNAGSNGRTVGGRR